MLKYCTIVCPYCGSSQTVAVDCSAEVQDYYEDCQVCCRSMSVHVNCSYEGELENLKIRDENEAGA